MLRTLIVTTALLASPALADIETKTTDKSVAETMDALEAAVTEAGATVFARVDHAAGAASVDMELAASEVLIFGNPQLGSQAMQDDPVAGLALPMKVLVYDDEGTTTVAFEEPDEMFDDMEIDDDADYVDAMEDALNTLTDKAIE